MNVIQKMNQSKTGSGKGFRTEAPRWLAGDAMDIKLALMVN